MSPTSAVLGADRSGEGAIFKGLAIAGGLAAQVETWTVTSDGGLMSTLLETISCST